MAKHGSQNMDRNSDRWYYKYFGGGSCVYQGKLQFRIQRREVSKTFLKTVSAYANYNDGDINFGLDGNGNVVGVKGSPKEEALRIENMINDSLSPAPYFEMISKEVEGKTIIILEVKKGKDTPYYYKGKATKEGILQP